MHRPLSACALFAVLTLPGFGLIASDPVATPEAPVVRKPAPVLQLDNSPVSDGKAGLVTSYADVVEPAEKAVVSVESTKTVHPAAVNPMLRQFFRDLPEQGKDDDKETGLGSGVIVAANGYILTNNHVVEGFETFKVTLKDGREFPAKVVGADPKTDVAVIKIEAAGLPVLTLADSDKLRVGDIVFAVGDPLDVGETVTMGIVSAKGRKLGLLDDVEGYENFIQTDAAINLGNSGGALLDAKGRLIGVNSAIVSPSRGNIGIGFAIPINLAATVMTSLIETGTVRRGFLGVETQGLTPDVAEQVGLPKDAAGTIVTDVIAGSPAAKAGIQRSDVILALNDKPAPTLEDLHFMIGQMLPGAKVALKIIRDGKPLTISLLLGAVVNDPDELLKGVDAVALTDELRRKLELDSSVNGVVITTVAKDSPYAERLEANMVIVEIGRTPVTDLPAARALLRPGRHLLFVYARGAQEFVPLIVPEDHPEERP
jgi:serine protease Do/serine protease DegQ